MNNNTHANTLVIFNVNALFPGASPWRDSTYTSSIDPALLKELTDQGFRLGLSSGFFTEEQVRGIAQSSDIATLCPPNKNLEGIFIDGFYLDGVTHIPHGPGQHGFAKCGCPDREFLSEAAQNQRKVVFVAQQSELQNIACRSLNPKAAQVIYMRSQDERLGGYEDGFASTLKEQGVYNTTLYRRGKGFGGFSLLQAVRESVERMETPSELTTTAARMAPARAGAEHVGLGAKTPDVVKR